MNSWLIVGIGLLAFAAVQTLWVARTDAPPHVAAQALVFGELGLMAMAKALIDNEFAATVVMAVLGVGALVSVAIQIKLVRDWRRGSRRGSGR